MPMFYHTQALAKTSEKLTPLLNGCKENRDHWQTIAEECKQPMVEKKEQASSDEKDIDESEALPSSTVAHPSNKD